MKMDNPRVIGRSIVFALCVLLQFSSGAHGQTLGGLMSHVQIGVTGGQVLVYKDDPGLIPEMIGPDAFSSPFSVLNGRGYNAQFGWTALFPFNLHGDLIWIRLIEQTEGLLTFEGGWADDAGTGIPDPDDQSMLPIFETYGSPDIWSWSGSMTHNWYAASVPGEYSASYEVYVGDTLGIMNTDYTPAQVTFEFNNTIELLVGDLNSDGLVGLTDLSFVLNQWDEVVRKGDPLMGDLSGDGLVGLEDLSAVLNNWDRHLPSSHGTSVPEPMSGMLWLGLLAFTFKGRYVQR